MSPKHQRALSQAQARKAPVSAKPKPPPLRRGHSHGPVSTQGPNGKSLLGGTKKETTEIFVDGDGDDDELGSAGFIQFCATCETQIVSPGNNILYCSQACRERDACNTSPPSDPRISPPVTRPASGYFDSSPNIVPPRSPTVLRPLALSLSDLALSDMASETTSDSNESPGRQDSYVPAESEAAQFLARFRCSAFALAAPPPGAVAAAAAANTSSNTSRSRRPAAQRTITAQTDHPPSLSHTPSSSVGTAASGSSASWHWPNTSAQPSPAFDPYIPRRASAVSSPNDPTTTATGVPGPRTRSIDLVTPYYHRSTHDEPAPAVPASLKSSASTLTSLRVVEADARYSDETDDDDDDDDHTLHGAGAGDALRHRRRPSSAAIDHMRLSLRRLGVGSDAGAGGRGPARR